MEKENHYPPSYGAGQFHCPHCNVFAKQFWAHLQADQIWSDSVLDRQKYFSESLKKTWCISKCEHCQGKIIWLNSSIIYPKRISVSHPNKDLDEDIKKDYLEAATIFNDSPRAAAALLRLALQKLCKQLGEKGENINDDIGNLVKKGLSPQIQKSLDSLRVTGNNANHPGQINLSEEPERALKLFELLNFIANKMISEPKEIDAFYEGLPEKSKVAIEVRDKKVKAKSQKTLPHSSS